MATICWPKTYFVNQHFGLSASCENPETMACADSNMKCHTAAIRLRQVFQLLKSIEVSTWSSVEYPNWWTDKCWGRGHSLVKSVTKGRGFTILDFRSNNFKLPKSIIRITTRTRWFRLSTRSINIFAKTFVKSNTKSLLVRFYLSSMYRNYGDRVDNIQLIEKGCSEPSQTCQAYEKTFEAAWGQQSTSDLNLDVEASEWMK